MNQIPFKNMTYKQFEKIMTEYISLCEDEDAFNQAFKKLDPDFNYVGFGRHHDITLTAIKLAMNDQYDYISYWLYDLDRGKKWKKGTVTDNDGTDIPLKTLRNLFDHIKKENTI